MDETIPTGRQDTQIWGVNGILVCAIITGQLLNRAANDDPDNVGSLVESTDTLPTK